MRDDERMLGGLAVEIADLEKQIAVAQAEGRLPAWLPEIEAADRRRRRAEARARVYSAIAELAEIVAKEID